MYFLPQCFLPEWLIFFFSGSNHDFLFFTFVEDLRDYSVISETVVFLPLPHDQSGKRRRIWLYWGDERKLQPLLSEFTAVLPDFRFWSQAASQGCQQSVFRLHLVSLCYFLVTTVIKLWSLSSWGNYMWHDACYGMSSIWKGKERVFLGWPDRLKPVRYFLFLHIVNENRANWTQRWIL